MADSPCCSQVTEHCVGNDVNQLCNEESGADEKIVSLLYCMHKYM